MSDTNKLIQITEKVKGVFDKIMTPARTLPKLLLLCTIIKRPGASALNAAARIIHNNGGLGINTGTGPDGSMNYINAFTYNIVKEVFREIKLHGVIHSVIPKGSLQMTGTGANAGGPMTVTSINVMDVVIKGLFR